MHSNANNDADKYFLILDILTSIILFNIKTLEQKGGKCNVTKESCGLHSS